MKALLESTNFILILIFGSYLFGQWIFKKTKIAILHPLIVSIAIIIIFLQVTKIDFQKFEEGSRFVSFLLGPSVVALGYILYEQMKYLKGNVISILCSIFMGSITGIVSVIVLAKITGADNAIMMSLEPKSVTTAIALNISSQYGGIPSLTAVIVLFCGIFGGIIGPYVLKILRVKSSIAKGLALGASSHSVGTVKAMEMGVIEGAISGLAIGLMGVMTALLIPLIEQLIHG